MTVNPGQLFSNHYAFLVGVDGYRDPNFANLGGAHADAKAMYEALLAVGYPADNLRLVPPENTSLSALLDELHQFASLARQCLKRTDPSRPDILVFWAGHGVPDDHTSYLITQDSQYGDVERSAIPLGDVIELFRNCAPVSLAIFFDVCHSIPRDRPDLHRDAKNLILVPMRNNIKINSLRWSFVGVSTYAYEHFPAPAQRGESTAKRGILATVLERAILGRPCDDLDGEICSDLDGVVSVERLLSKLQHPVERRATDLGLFERVAVLRDRDGLDHPKAIGLDVERFLDKKELSLQANLLARMIVGRATNISEFGQKSASLVSDLIRGTLEPDDFLRRERALVRSAILDLRTDPNLNAYTGLLLHCRQEAARDAAARDVLVRLYEHLVWGGSPGVFEEYLRSQDRLFASRDALPWSCGIRVLRGEDEHGYAPILKAGAAVRPSSNDASRTFVTTSTLQLKALIHIYRGDATVSSIRNSDLQSCDYLTAAKFAHELAVGTRVWVKMGPDENGCGPGCEDQATSVYAPMSILLGREGIKEHDWKGHWHLDLGGTDDEIGGGPGPDPEPVWVTRMERIIDECLQFLMTLEGGHAEEMEKVVIDWLYNAERLMRARDESKLRHVLEKLIEGLRRNPASSALRLSGALHSAVDPSTGGLQQPITGEKGSTEAYKKVSRDVLEYYERWRADHAREAPQGELGNHEILAWLLQAVIAPPGNPLRIATENVAGFMFETAMTEPVRPVGAARAVSAVFRVIDQGSAHFARDRQVTRGLLARAVNNVVQPAGSDLFSTQQQRILLRWIESTTEASEQDSVENASRQLLTLLRTEIGLGTLLLAQGFLDVMGVGPLSLPTFDELMTRLRHGADISDTREAAEQMYRLLRQLYLDRLQSGGLLREDAAVFLLALAALLWPENEELVMRLLTTAAVDWPTATEISHEALDLDQDNLAGVVDADLSTDQLLKNAAMVDQVRQSWNRIRQMGQIVYGRTPLWKSPPPTDVRGPDAERWHDPMLLGIPAEESHQV